MIELLAVRTFIAGIFSFWHLLPTPIKVLIYIGMAFLSGFVWGTHKTSQKYEARIDQSIQEAKRIDKAANQSALENMLSEKNKWQKQSLENENKLSEYATEYAQMKEVCKNDKDFVKRNNDIDLLLNPRRMSK